MPFTFRCTEVHPCQYNRPVIDNKGNVSSALTDIVSVRFAPVDEAQAAWPLDAHGDLQLHSILPEAAKDFEVGALYTLELTRQK